LTKSEKELLHKLKNVVVSERVYNFYKTKLKNNQNDSMEICRKKLIRNILLAERTPVRKERKERHLFYMGNLSILYDEILNEIVWIDNKEGYYPCYIDNEKKEWLNRELGINTYKIEKVG
jgi:hypothetical protein